MYLFCKNEPLHIKVCNSILREDSSDRGQTLASSLATVLSKSLGARNSSNAALLDRIPAFVSREKRSKAILGHLRAKKTVQVCMTIIFDLNDNLNDYLSQFRFKDIRSSYANIIK